MGLFEHWPYVNFHELNLNWIIQTIRGLETRVTKLEAEEGGNTPAADAHGLSGSINAGTLQRLYDVMLSYCRHNNDLVYMHKCSSAYDYHTGLQDDGKYYGNSAMMFPLPVTVGKCGTGGRPYQDAQGNDREGMAINCTTFALLTILGIPYERTNYADPTINTLDQIGTAGYAFNPWQDLITYRNLEDVYNTLKFYQRMKALGMGCAVQRDMRNIKPGNVIWQTRDGQESGIFHCGIVAAVAPLRVSGASNTSSYLICEVRNAPYPVTFRWRSAADMITEGWLFTASPDYGICQPQPAECLYRQHTGAQSTTITGMQIQNGEILTFDFDYTPAALGDYLTVYINGTNARTPSRPDYITAPLTSEDLGIKKHFTFAMPMQANTGMVSDPNTTIETIAVICHGSSGANNAALDNLSVWRGIPSSLEEQPHVLRISTQAEYEAAILACFPDTNRAAGYDVPVVLAPLEAIEIGGATFQASTYAGVIHVQNSSSAKRCVVEIKGYAVNLRSKYSGSTWTHTSESI